MHGRLGELRLSELLTNTTRDAPFVWTRVVSVECFEESEGVMSTSSKSNAKSIAKQWFVLTKQGERGPYSTTDLKRFAWQGHIRRATQVRLADGKWFEAGRVEGLWDVRWRRPNGEVVADGQAAADEKQASRLSIGANRILSLIGTATTWLTKPCALATCSASEPAALPPRLRQL